jgi:O-antigen/teichoic acid export membrane protein
MTFFCKKIFFNSLIYTILPKISIVSSLLILPFISPYLTLEDYGIYGLLMSYVGVFHMFIGLGQVVLLQNSFFTHKNKYKLVWRRSYAIMILAGILSSVFLSFFLNFFLADSLGTNFWLVVIMVSIYLVLSPLDYITINFYTLHEFPIPYAYIMGIIGVVTTLLTLITIKFLGLGYMGWVLNLSLTAILTNILFTKRIFFKERIYPEIRFNKRFFYKSLKIGLPLTPHQLSLYILSVSDRLFLEFYKVPIKQIGFYSQGYTIGGMGNIVVNGVFQAFTKKIHEGMRSEDINQINFIRKIIIFLPVFISCVFFIGSFWSQELFILLFKNKELQNSYPVTIVVLSSYMFLSLYSIFSYPLSIQNRTFSISKITMFAAVVNIVGNLIFIPKYGIWASLGVTYFSYLIFGFAGLLDRKNRLFLNKYVNITKLSLLLFVINFSFFVISYSLKDINYLYKILITLLLITFGMLVKSKSNHFNALYNI